MIGATGTVTIEHLTQTRDAHGGKVDGAADSAVVSEAVISRASIGNLWRMTVDGDHTRIGETPSEWRVTDDLGRVFNPVKVTYRPPIPRVGESEHTLILAELLGEVDTDRRT